MLRRIHPAVLVVLAAFAWSGLLVVGMGLNQKAAAPTPSLACTDCLIGCVCGDCAKCTPAPVACKCEPGRPCPCPAKPAQPGIPVVNVICCFCKHSFPVPARVIQTQCPNCLAPLVVHGGSTGQVGALKKDAVPKWPTR